MESVNKEKAAEIIHQVGQWQEKLQAKIGTRFAFAADEFFLLAESAIPVADYYEGYVQIENGVGLIRQFEDEALDTIRNFSGEVKSHAVTVGTSVGASSMMNRIERAIKEKFPEVDLNIKVIENHFFGEKITVSGLLTATDIINQLRGEMVGRRLLLSESVINSDGLLLDDKTPADISKALASPVSILKVSGLSFIEAVLGGKL
jgi:NifB/MoaA-like Fe-S oxidoreductase